MSHSRGKRGVTSRGKAIQFSGLPTGRSSCYLSRSVFASPKRGNKPFICGIPVAVTAFARFSRVPLAAVLATGLSVVFVGSVSPRLACLCNMSIWTRSGLLLTATLVRLYLDVGIDVSSFGVHPLIPLSYSPFPSLFFPPFLSTFS